MLEMPSDLEMQLLSQLPVVKQKDFPGSQLSDSLLICPEFLESSNSVHSLAHFPNLKQNISPGLQIVEAIFFSIKLSSSRVDLLFSLQFLEQRPVCRQKLSPYLQLLDVFCMALRRLIGYSLHDREHVPVLTQNISFGEQRIYFELSSASSSSSSFLCTKRTVSSESESYASWLRRLQYFAQVPVEIQKTSFHPHL